MYCEDENRENIVCTSIKTTEANSHEDHVLNLKTNGLKINHNHNQNGVMNGNGIKKQSLIANKDKIHVEICQKSTSQVKSEYLKPLIMNFLKKILNVNTKTNIQMSVVNGLFTQFDDNFLNDAIESIMIPDFQAFMNNENLTNIECHIYQLSEMGPNVEELDENDECLPAANHWILPCREFNGIWESLEFDSDIKSQLMRYANTALLFSDRGVDSNIINWNKVILFHGPPGTGKTSLCKGLAQKLSIYLSHRYSYGQFVEINSHSLFSKWFSESGKLVSKMFDKIQQLVDDKNAFVIVLIDEVESLTAARKQSFKSAEPSDSIRVVNALLTQIDQIRRHPNVLILTTSNVTGAIDVAFIDRADIKQYIGPPSTAAIYRIFDSCLQELMRTKIIQPEQPILSFNAIEDIEVNEPNVNLATKLCLKLKETCIGCENFSGRTLRKIMFLCYSNYIQPKTCCDLDEFLDALKIQVEKYRNEKHKLSDTIVNTVDTLY